MTVEEQAKAYIEKELRTSSEHEIKISYDEPCDDDDELTLIIEGSAIKTNPYMHKGNEIDGMIESAYFISYSDYEFCGTVKVVDERGNLVKEIEI